MTDTKHPEALRLAALYDADAWPGGLSLNAWAAASAAELRRLHAENTTLQQGYDAARMEIESLRDEVKEYRHGAGVQKALIETLLADKPAGEYPPLPEHAALIMRGKPLHRNWIRHVDTPVFTADQMRAYVDADRAMRAAQAAPASQDAATGLKDGDIAALVNRLRDIAIEYSDTQQLRERIASEIRPRAAGLVGVASQDAEDAARYRWLAAHCRSTAEHWGGRWSIVVEGPAPKSHDSEDDFDAAIDAARGAQRDSNG